MTTRGPQFKLVLLGEVGVGKTSLFFRIRDDSYIEGRRPTYGIDSCSRIVSLDKTTHVTFSLWDTAGVEKFRTLTRNYYRSTQVSVLVYSLDNPHSLHHLPKWMEDARDFSPKSLKILVGNKSDLEQTVKQSTIDNFADINEIDLIFTVSAKTGAGIEDMLQRIATALYLKNKQGQNEYEEMKAERRAKIKPSKLDLTKTKCDQCCS